MELENGTLQEPSFNCSVTLDDKTSFDSIFWMTETPSGDVKKITSQDDDNVKVIAHAFDKPLLSNKLFSARNKSPSCKLYSALPVSIGKHHKDYCDVVCI